MRKYILHFSFVFFLICTPIFGFSLWTQPLYGDLTRIGRWASHDFGPNSSIPTINVKASGRALDNSDAVVLGDSFSQRNLWQSVLTEKTHNVIKTYDYGNCIPTFIKSAIENSSNKVVIIETVERSFIQRFNYVPSCSKKLLVPSEIKAETVGGIPRPKWPISTDFWHTTTTAINTIRSSIFNEKYSKRYNTVNTDLSDECALFSNRKNKKFLYYADDDLKSQWSEIEIKAAISNVLNIQKQVERSGKKFIFIIAPDKSSVYKKCIKTGNINLTMPDINQLLIDAGVNAPNLHYVFKEKINTIVDLYDPDNTHWSESGYILAGETIGDYLLSMPAKH